MKTEEFLREEFITLREEIGARHSRKFKVMTAGLFGAPALTFAGKYLEEQDGIGVAFLAIAPIIVFISCCVYVYENNGIMRAGYYIRTQIEPNISSIPIYGWEAYLHDYKNNGSRSVDKYLNLCVFVVGCLYYIGTVCMFFAYTQICPWDMRIGSSALAAYVIIAGLFLYLVFEVAMHSTDDPNRSKGHSHS